MKCTLSKLLGWWGPGKDHRQQGGASLVELGRGYFEFLNCLDNQITISGWMFHPNGAAIDSYSLYINGIEFEKCRAIRREDVAKAFPIIPNAENSGFSFTFDKRDENDEMLDVRVIGTSKGRKLAKMETWYLKDIQTYLPTPPPHHISRVVGNENPSFYLATGIQNYRVFWTSICKYTDPDSIESMLDWGCGSGRITGFFSKFSGIPKVCGCDIDMEAIAWCQEHLKPAEFSVNLPHPPTTYADRTFDIIISFSVFTHLSRQVQFSWLREMQRILSPGGLFLATVHGEFATAFNFPDKKSEDILKSGIYEVADDRLNGIAPNGYYRGVFQSKEYTIREWANYFEILEYKERVASNYQDLVVM